MRVSKVHHAAMYADGRLVSGDGREDHLLALWFGVSLLYCDGGAYVDENLNGGVRKNRGEPGDRRLSRCRRRRRILRAAAGLGRGEIDLHDRQGR